MTYLYTFRIFVLINTIYKVYVSLLKSTVCLNMVFINKYPESVQICHLFFISSYCKTGPNVSKYKIELNLST